MKRHGGSHKNKCYTYGSCTDVIGVKITYNPTLNITISNSTTSIDRNLCEPSSGLATKGIVFDDLSNKGRTAFVYANRKQNLGGPRRSA